MSCATENAIIPSPKSLLLDVRQTVSCESSIQIKNKLCEPKVEGHRIQFPFQKGGMGDREELAQGKMETQLGKH